MTGEDVKREPDQDVDKPAGPDVAATLAELSRELWVLMRSTDSFRSLTVGAAEGIGKRAGENRSLARSLREQRAIGNGISVEGLADRLDRQADSEQRFADWLRGLGVEGA